MGWRVERYTNDAGSIHALGMPADAVRTLRVYEPSSSALVLGSTQPETDVDYVAAHQLDVQIVRRRSGGGAVLVEPDDVVWFDVVLPRYDALWHDDVGRSFYWLGEVLVSALADVGYENAVAYKGPLITTDWSRQVCFAGLGPGEVTLAAKKVVGISQRRTRTGAQFQVAVVKRFDAAKLEQLLGLPAGSAAGIAGELPELDAHAFIDLLLQRLTAL